MQIHVEPVKEVPVEKTLNIIEQVKKNEEELKLKQAKDIFG